MTASLGVSSVLRIPASPAPILAIPTGKQIVDYLKTSGIRAYVLNGEVGFTLERAPEQDTVNAWRLPNRSPGWLDAVKRYYLDR